MKIVAGLLPIPILLLAVGVPLKFSTIFLRVDTSIDELVGRS
jgi:hypothetical protein